MSKSQKTQTKATKAEANFKAAAKVVSAKMREKSKDLILPADKKPKEAKEPKTSKKQLILDMLKRPEGATITELEEATGWQSHSVRGALVNLKNKDKHPVTNSKEEDGPRRYFLKGKEAPQPPVSQPEPEGNTTSGTEAPANEEAA